VIANETMRPAFARAAQAAPAATAGLAHAATLRAPATFGGEPQDETADANDICRSCGACCSYSADWPRFSLESEADLARIPPELIDEGQGGMRCDGTRCAALVGTVGRSTACAIYEARPDVCRACVPGDGACQEARRHFGLGGVRGTPDPLAIRR
jgi:Fe-S-cluster containining protein